MDTIPETLSSSVKSTTSNTFQNDRKRRDNINERIQELLTLIPSEFFADYYNGSAGTDSSGPGTMSDTPGSAAKAKGTGTKDGKPNKGQILTQAVEYITNLQNQVDIKNREEIELMMKVQSLIKKTGAIIKDINLDNTSAEVELAKIGVGPLAGTAEQTADSKSNEIMNSNGYSEYD
ncbi:hypothetical protein KAFR_0F02140 [Kazachstania africana CBS 2517]|uniref:BHLH domain-containing protein n=1 Tax=Kazachstania africana (strain ATCC 22294 / BCRC 22015 / CBS 2517 / CECT 1963 / NBRC 1671 / NRRL Y-8276) TaxID=1071382 RepID=H2AWR1_KAZAF|nr:hypothetical protein KAFR_0F02140 [Kazachstania africana CBS 2517]CCF58811.1 hypothetical protein KAFR_0F02140 [Kazachstania africana CBS 2517]